jgi:hypothetical protein
MIETVDFLIAGQFVRDSASRCVPLHPIVPDLRRLVARSATAGSEWADPAT